MPAYLEQHRQEMAAAQEQYDRYVQESLQRGQMQQVAGDKRYVQLSPQVQPYILMAQ